MTRTTDSVAVEREIAIDARPETVWEYLVDPARATRWMGVAADLEPTPGGRYVVDVLPGHTARGEFVEVDPPRRVVFTWGWDAEGEGDGAVPPGSTTVEIDLVPDGGGTLLRLLHRLPSAEQALRHAPGWDHYLGRLARVGGGGDAGLDPWLAGAA